MQAWRGRALQRRCTRLQKLSRSADLKPQTLRPTKSCCLRSCRCSAYVVRVPDSVFWLEWMPDGTYMLQRQPRMRCSTTCPQQWGWHAQVLSACVRCPGGDCLTNDNVIDIFHACFRIGHYQTERSKDMSGAHVFAVPSNKCLQIHPPSWLSSGAVVLSAKLARSRRLAEKTTVC